jgi:UMF1 family MFS transporter
MSRRAQWSWILIDMGNSAFATTVIAAVFPVYLPSLLPKEGVHFNIGPFDWTSNALSIWGYTVSFSIFLTFLVSPILGAWADEGGYRKRLLGIFTLLGALGTIGLGWYEL